ncbi:unnamed protein product [Amoebophrya sp. A120]|nr:unnamed protein product [Amoebophrya sp. A120]|eukprot:GSA120T00018167001.1
MSPHCNCKSCSAKMSLGARSRGGKIASVAVGSAALLHQDNLLPVHPGMKILQVDAASAHEDFSTTPAKNSKKQKTLLAKKNNISSASSTTTKITTTWSRLKASFLAKKVQKHKQRCSGEDEDHSATRGTTGGASTSTTVAKVAPPIFDAPPSLYYSSNLACTAADGGDTRKCTPKGNIQCHQGTTEGAWCDESEKASCNEMGAASDRATDADSADTGFGFMCPHMMIGSSELIAAAQADGLDPSVHAYGVATFDKLKCGQCIEVRNRLAGQEPRTINALKRAPVLTVQIFNSVAEAVDIYMSVGGLGAHNGCHAVGGYTQKASQYHAYPVGANQEWLQYLHEHHGYKEANVDLQPTVMDAVIANQGGIRGGRSYAECADAALQSGKDWNHVLNQCCPDGNGCNGGGGICIRDKAACDVMFQGKSDHTHLKALESCRWTFDHDLHWNRPIQYRIVPCPASLVRVTGLMPSHSPPMPAGPEDGWQDSRTTTMEDCSLPTCSRSPNTNNTPDPPGYQKWHNAMYSCDVFGEVLTMKNRKTNLDTCVDTSDAFSA